MYDLDVKRPHLGRAARRLIDDVLN